MEDFNKQQHWEKIYTTKQLDEVSWYQPTPTTSLNYFQKLNLPLTASIIDVGGGDSFLVDHLLKLGYTNLSVLDISAASLNRAQKRLGKQSNLVKWIIADASNFQPTEQYDCWHDRAAFHFLTSATEINNYLKIVSKSIHQNGHLIIGTFSEQGPTKCSGINIKQYSPQSLAQIFSSSFTKIGCELVDHTTPFNTVQNFVFCSFYKN